MKKGITLLMILLSGIIAISLLNAQTMKLPSGGLMTNADNYLPDNYILNEESSALPNQGFLLTSTGLFVPPPLYSPLPASVDLPSKSYFVNVYLGPSYLQNKDIKDQNWDMKKKIGYQVEFGYLKRMSELLSYGVGLGISSYPSEISIEKVLDTLIVEEDPTVIEPNDILHKRIEYKGITEKVNVTYFDVPVFLEFGNANWTKMGYFVRVGVKLSLPIGNSFSGSGMYSIKGYYPEYHAELEGINELGFVSNANLFATTNDEKLNSINVSGAISAGLSFPLKVESDWIFRIGASYVHGFTDIAKGTNDLNSIEQTGINHILDNKDSKTYTRAFTINVGIQYILDIY